jgi:aldose 1-epimerase
MNLTKSACGTVQGHTLEKYTITDPKSGFMVELSNLGATLVRVKTPDRSGKVEDVNFGLEDPAKYFETNGYLGALVGRVANRISNAKFTLDGKEYTLFINNANKHALHGGKVGFNLKWWELIDQKISSDEISLTFRYISKDGEEGYPGTLTTLATYLVTPTSVGWELEATTDKPTIINLTNHSYWNLGGLNSVIDSHEITVNADEFLVGDADNLATGEIKKVDQGKIDLRTPKDFATLFATFGDIDNSFILNGFKNKKWVGEVFCAAELYCKKSGRKMTVLTSEPQVQVYTGNYMEGIVSLGVNCKKHSAVCLETQRAPNAINNPKFADTVILRPKQRYCHKTIHQFSVK